MNDWKKKWIIASLAINPSATPFENWKRVKSPKHKAEWLQLHTFATHTLPTSWHPSPVSDSCGCWNSSSYCQNPSPSESITNRGSTFSGDRVSLVFFRESVKDFLPLSPTRKSHLGLRLWNWSPVSSEKPDFSGSWALCTDPLVDSASLVLWCKSL